MRLVGQELYPQPIFVYFQFKNMFIGDATQDVEDSLVLEYTLGSLMYWLYQTGLFSLDFL